MKREKILSFLGFISDDKNREVFVFEFPASRSGIHKIRTAKNDTKKEEQATALYDFLGTRFKDNIDMLRTRVGWITDAKDWWLDDDVPVETKEEIVEPKEEKMLTLNTLRGFIRVDTEFYKRFHYLEELIDEYKTTNNEQVFTDIVFSFFTHSKNRKDFYEFFAGYTLADDIEERFGYAI